jgi:Bacterial PH domain/Short C-terminal domain
MARYADSLLSEGEQIIMRTRQHWLATVIDARYPWLLLLAGLVLLVLQTNLGVSPVVDGFRWVIFGLIAVSLAWLAKTYISWWNQDYMVTSRRVLKVEGIVNKRSGDSSLEKINDAVLEQNLFGRMFNYGDLDILTAADTAIDHYRMLDKAPQFKRQMLNMKHELEGEFSRPMPSPPLRAAPVGAAAAQGAAVYEGGGAVAAPPAAPAGPRQMTADEVTRALASLADLRDRGAISTEEYDAKKSDLLARL